MRTFKTKSLQKSLFAEKVQIILLFDALMCVLSQNRDFYSLNFARLDLN